MVNQCKKRAVLILCLLQLTVSLCLAYFLVQGTGSLARSGKISHDEATFFWCCCIACISLGVIFNSLGLYATLREHYYLTVAYAYLMTLYTMCVLVPPFLDHLHWPTFILSGGATVAAFIYARELKHRRGVQQNADHVLNAYTDEPTLYDECQSYATTPGTQYEPMKSSGGKPKVVDSDKKV